MSCTCPIGTVSARALPVCADVVADSAKNSDLEDLQPELLRVSCVCLVLLCDGACGQASAHAFVLITCDVVDSLLAFGRFFGGSGFHPRLHLGLDSGFLFLRIYVHTYMYISVDIIMYIYSWV